MKSLPANLTLFGSLQQINQTIIRNGLLLKAAHQIGDPFLPSAQTPFTLTSEALFDSAVKYIAHAILGRTAPRGQPNHPMQKAISRWRLEDRFKDEGEVREALKGLLPAIVDNVFKEAQNHYQSWQDFVHRHKMVCLFESFSDINLWRLQAANHRGAAIKFKVDTDSIFNRALAVQYRRVPPTTADLKHYTEFLIGNIPAIEFDPLELILAQTQEWRKFREWRLLVENSEIDEDILEFSTSDVQSIYLGAAVTPEKVSQFSQYLSKAIPQAGIYQARCKTTEYGLEFVKLN